MQLDTSGKPSNALLRAIIRSLREYRDESQKPMTVIEMVRICCSAGSFTEAEARQAIRWGASHGCFTLSGDPSDEKSGLSLADLVLTDNTNQSLNIIVSIPRFTELGLDRMRQDFGMMETREAFRKVIMEARSTLRISSPFIEKNILDDDVMPDIVERIKFSLERGCQIRLLTREAAKKRKDQVQWLVDLVENDNRQEQLQLFDYHLQDENSRIVSSTHSKLVIADSSIAYVGSAEMRRNSLKHNFEVGCLLGGPKVVGLCHVFDLMTRYAERVY